MKQNSLFFYLLLVILAIAVTSSCEDDEEITPSMTGTLTYDLPNYCYVGAIFDLQSKPGITDPTDGVTYHWRSDSDDILKDTIPGLKYTMVIPDTIGTYSIIAYAEAEGYYSKVNSKVVVAIDATLDVEGSSVKGIEKTASGGFFVDARDGITYYTEPIGNLHWFIQNLRYAGDKNAPIGTVGVAYKNEEVLADIFGRLYTWTEATKGITSSGLGGGTLGICPNGWSIPTKEDWEDFGKILNEGEEISYDDMWFGLAGKAVVEATLNGEEMWPYNYKINRTNDHYWNGIPAGNSLLEDDRFENILLYGMWWSGTEASETEASYRYIYYDNTFFAPHEVSKTEFGASVRCVKKI